MKKNKHLGSDFDDFLKEENLLPGAEAVAAKRIVSFQIKKKMEDTDKPVGALKESSAKNLKNLAGGTMQRGKGQNDSPA